MSRFFGVYLLVALSLVALPLAGVLITSAAVSPDAIDRGEIALTPPCPTKLASKPCRTCGLTRSFAATSRGRVADAWRYNRAGLPLYLSTWLALFAVTGTALRVYRDIR